MKNRIFSLIVVLFFVTSTTAAATDDAKKQPVSKILYEVITEKGIDAAVKQYHSLKKKKLDKYDFKEAELNTLGYRLLGEKKNAEAIAILKLNTEAYPKSPNAYDSLGEANMRDGNNDMAIQNYEKSLSLLASVDIDENTRTLLERNANSNISYLRNPESLMESTVISDFISENSDSPFGKLNPKAPKETEEFGQLAGVWQCTNFAFVNGQWFSGWPATWVWKYVLDGFAVQDLWFQKEENLPPPRVSLHRDYSGTNMRIYDTAKEKWEIMWFHNGLNSKGTPNGTSQFEAEFMDDQIIMTPKNPGSGTLRRIVFHNITADSFDWKSETSEDEGETWKPRFRIEGKRSR